MQVLIYPLLLLALPLDNAAQQHTILKANVLRLPTDNPVIGGFVRRKCFASPRTEPWRYWWTHPDGTTSTGQYLIINNLQRSQMGYHMCFAESLRNKVNRYTLVSDGENAYFNPGSARPSQPSSEQEPTNRANVVIMSGDNPVIGGVVRRKCSPSPDSNLWRYSWRHPDGTMSQGQYLYISNLRGSQMGDYTCYARLAMYTAVGRTTVYSNGRSTNYNPGSSRPSQPSYADQETRSRATVVIMSGDNPVVGGFIRRKCSATPTTKPWRYSWTHPDGATSEGRYLNVDYLRSSQMGTYTCSARSAGQTVVGQTVVQS